MVIGDDTDPDEAIMHVIMSTAEAGQLGRIAEEACSLPAMPGGVVIMVPVPRSRRGMTLPTDVRTGGACPRPQDLLAAWLGAASPGERGVHR